MRLFVYHRSLLADNDNSKPNKVFNIGRRSVGAMGTQGLLHKTKGSSRLCPMYLLLVLRLFTTFEFFVITTTFWRTKNHISFIPQHSRFPRFQPPFSALSLLQNISRAHSERVSADLTVLSNSLRVHPVSCTKLIGSFTHENCFDERVLVRRF